MEIDRQITEKSASSRNVLSLKISDQNMLFNCYMPFLTNGGLFIPTNKTYEMGEKVFILLSLMDEVEKLAITSKIVWISNPGFHTYQKAGIGVHFSNEKGDAVKIRNTIEKYLVGRVDYSPLPTYTM